MNIDKLQVTLNVKEMLKRRLSKKDCEGGCVVEFARCEIKEGKPYLGHVIGFDIEDTGEMELHIELDKDPDYFYSKVINGELFVGSEMYMLFKKLGIVNRNDIACLDDLIHQRVWVTLQWESDHFIVDVIGSAETDEEESFTEDDFSSNSEE